MRPNGAKRAVAALAVLLAACVSAPVSEPPTRPSGPTLGAPAGSPLAELERSYRERALALSREGRLSEAQSLWEVLVLLQPESADYRAQLEQTQRRIADAVAERLKAAEKARQAGDLEQATMRYLRVLSVDPQNVAAARALRELDAGRVKRAYLSRPPRVAVASRPPAGRNDSRSAVAPSASELGELELGVGLSRQGDYAGSVQSLEKYLQSHPRDDHARGDLADAYYQLGLASLRLGRKEEAFGYLEKAQRLGPTDPAEAAKTLRAVRQALGEEYYRLGLQAFASNLDKAIALWERSVYYDPDQTQAQVRLQQARRAQATMRSIDQNTKN